MVWEDGGGNPASYPIFAAEDYGSEFAFGVLLSFLDIRMMLMSTITLVKEDQDLILARQLANLLDTAFEIPGTRIRVGLYALLGLFPVIGDLICSLIGAYILVVACRLGVSRVVIWRMMWNLGVESAIGLFPLLGSAFDLYWKANIANVTLIESYLANPQAVKRKSLWILLGVVCLFLLIGAALTAGIWLLVWAIGNSASLRQSM